MWVCQFPPPPPYHFTYSSEGAWLSLVQLPELIQFLASRGTHVWESDFSEVAFCTSHWERCLGLERNTEGLIFRRKTTLCGTKSSCWHMGCPRHRFVEGEECVQRHEDAALEERKDEPADVETAEKDGLWSFPSAGYINCVSSKIGETVTANTLDVQILFSSLKCWENNWSVLSVYALPISLS